MKTLRLTLLCYVLVSAFSILSAQQTYDVRFKLEGVDCEKKSACYYVQLRAANGVDWKLAGQNYRIFYDASKAKYQVGSGTSQLPPDDYSPFTLTTNVPGTDASAFNGLLPFDATLGFLNYSIDLMDLASGGIGFDPDGEWVNTTLLCFDLEDETIDDVDACLNLVWARPGLTDSYATAFVEVSEWVGQNATENAEVDVYDDLDENDGDDACISVACGVGNPTEVSDAACSDGIDNDGDGLVDCNDPGCENAMACVEEEQQFFGVRMSLESFDCANNQACYSVELKSEGRTAFLLGNQSYSLFYNSDVGSFVQGTAVMNQSIFTPFTLVENTENTNSSSLEGIPFDSDLGFLNFEINLNGTSGSAFEVPTNAYVKTATLCFDISDSAISNPDECFNVIWGQSGTTDAYSDSFVEIDEFISATESRMVNGMLYDNLDSNDGNASCFTTACNNIENTQALCTDGVDNDNDGLVDCADSDCSVFSECQTAQVFIGDFVFEDLNGNGIQDANEVGLNGITLAIFADADADGEIDDPNNPISTSTSADGTNGAGQYGFNVDAGSYIIRATGLNGFTITTRGAGDNFRTDNDFDRATGNSSTIAVVDGNVRDDYDLGLFRLASLGGIAFNDVNSDGLRQNGEDGINNIVVNLYADANQDGQADSATPIASTNTSTLNSTPGSYFFGDLNPGSYIVEFDAGVGLTVTEQNAGNNDNVDSDIDVSSGRTGTITLASGENVDNIYAGYISSTSVGDFVWNDANGNGVRDADESGINGITVRLYTAEGTLVRGSVTSNNPNTNQAGYYQFTDLEPGEYYVELVLGGMLVTSIPNAVSDNTIDSDITDANGPNTTNTFTLTQGQSISNLDAGIYLGASINGLVWLDEQKATAGIYEPGVDFPQEGVLVKLLNADGEVIAETRTNADGEYTFNAMKIGTYSVMVVLPTLSNGQQTSFVVADQGNDEGVDSDITNSTDGTTAPFALGVGEVVNGVSAGLQPGTVPIELISFSGYWDEKRDQNDLEWSTASEINNDVFEIERSLDPSAGFVKVGEVAGNGTSNTLNDYQYTDSDIALSGTYYYRLKQIDYNGDFDYSDVIAIDVNRIGKAYVNILENPISTKMSIEIFSEDDALAAMVLYDINGRVIQNVVDNAVTISSGKNRLHVNTESLNRGQYILTVTMADQRFVKKLIKL